MDPGIGAGSQLALAGIADPGLRYQPGIRGSAQNSAGTVYRPEQCRAVFDALHARREEFEAAYGRPLEWDPLEGRKACRISEPAGGSVEDEAEHEKYIEFFIDTGQRFRAAISAVNGALL